MSNKTLIIELPEEIAEYSRELRLFVDLMVTKLHLNRHKGFGDGLTPTTAMRLCRGEVTELRQALNTGSQEDVLFEAVDVANTAWLTAITATRLTKERFEEGRK